MNEILTSVTSPAWWLTAIFAGTLANIISVYLKSHLDNFWSSLSKNYKEKSASNLLARKEKVASLRADSNAVILAAIEVNYRRIRALTYFSLATAILIVIAQIDKSNSLPHKWTMIVCGVIFTVLYFSGLVDVKQALNLRGIINEALETSKDGS